MMGGDPITSERQRRKCLVRYPCKRAFDFIRAYREIREGAGINPIEPLRIFKKCSIASLANVGEDVAHDGIDIRRRLAFGRQESGKPAFKV